MKQSIGTIWITGLVITFMLIFVGYLTFMLSFSDTEKTKNDILSIIEKRNGITSMKPNRITKKTVINTNGHSGNQEMLVDFGTLQSINLYLKGRQYKQKGNCNPHSEDTWYGVKNLDLDSSYKVEIEEINETTKNNNYYYCFTKKLADDGRARSDGSYVKPSRAAYYRIMVFYYFDLPIIPVLKMPVEGRTGLITVPSYCEIKKFRVALSKSSYDKMCPQWNSRVLDK